jgi:hypothetical protein
MMRLILVALIVVWSGMVQPASAVEKASAHCPMTHVTGLGEGPTHDDAVEAAINDCIAKGGIEECCHKFHGPATCNWQEIDSSHAECR